MELALSFLILLILGNYLRDVVRHLVDFIKIVFRVLLYLLVFLLLTGLLLYSNLNFGGLF